jgi:hypothetical protein
MCGIDQSKLLLLVRQAKAPLTKGTQLRDGLLFRTASGLHSCFAQVFSPACQEYVIQNKGLNKVFIIKEMKLLAK